MRLWKSTFQKWNSKRCVHGMCLLAIILMVGTFGLNVFVDQISFTLFPKGKYLRDYLNQENDQLSVCKIPTLNPWDMMILKFIKHPKTINCDRVQPFLTFIDDDGYLRYNETEVKIYLDKNSSFVCHYSTFDRKCYGNDNEIQFDNEILLINATKLPKDTVEVKCKYKHNNEQFYRNVHAHPVFREDLIYAWPHEKQLNLLFLLIDSVSYSALQRNLPLTYNFTKNVMGVKYFKGLNKIGLNSFPNQMAYLTGLRVMDEQEDMLRETSGDYKKIKLDTWPYIFKLFSAKGYETTFVEDWPKWSIFKYPVSGGFTKKMFDHFYRPFWLTVKDATHENSSSHCFLNFAIPNILLDLTRRHVASGRDRLQFIWASISESSHQGDNEVEQIDLFLRDFWKELHLKQLLNKTAVIFASDHGVRMGWIRSTLVGLLEERLPFYGIWFPDWFYRLYPHIKTNINDNANVLSTSFDVYETMKDIVEANYNGYQRNVSSRGQSQLYKLPVNRTCASAAVPNHFCTCIKETELNVETDLAVNSSNIVLIHLNSILSNYSDLCQEVTLSKILYIRQIDYDQKLKKGVQSIEEVKKFNEKIKNGTQENSNNYPEIIRLALETNPFSATFEVVLKIKSSKNGLKIGIDGGIIRTSRYAGLSDCVKDTFIQRYCSCYNVTTN